jgi:hypothetical protein
VHDVQELAANLRVVHERPIKARFTLGPKDYFLYETENNFRTVSAAIKADELAL